MTTRIERLSTSVNPAYNNRRELEPASTSVDITAAPRAVLRESVRLLYRVLGEHRLGSAQGNAWAAVCADRERARERAEMFRVLEEARRR